ncbi:MAG: UDP-2,3-diacylglucosamine diphosphatase [Gammaproteobacteria bacterium]|nr:UDP-2,3-diacylglucosamine diphosphatase [Gammaproteobacteria bacterium]
MADTLFISDLHLSQERPGTLGLFFRFLAEQAAQADTLYILGDLFDAWIGDDNDAPPIPQILGAMQQLTASGTRLYIMHGNRDFLIAEGFAAATGCKLLADTEMVTLAGTPTLLTHGDLLCTDDVDYQRARMLVRNPAFIDELMSKSIPERIALAAEFRKHSGEATSIKAADIMDVNQQTVERYMTEAGVTRLIHGHTHRPATHDFTLDGEQAQRIVLPEWHDDHGGFLRVNGDGLVSESFS